MWSSLSFDFKNERACLSLNATAALLPCNPPVVLLAVISFGPVANDAIWNTLTHVVLQLDRLVKASAVPFAKQ